MASKVNSLDIDIDIDIDVHVKAHSEPAIH